MAAQFASRESFQPGVEELSGSPNHVFRRDSPIIGLHAKNAILVGDLQDLGVLPYRQFKEFSEILQMLGVLASSRVLDPHVVCRGNPDSD